MSGKVTHVRVGKNTTISCELGSYVKWYFSGGTLPDNAFTQYDGRFILLVNVQFYNSGLYTCKKDFVLVTYEDGLTLVVLGKIRRNT